MRKQDITQRTDGNLGGHVDLDPTVHHADVEYLQVLGRMVGPLTCSDVVSPPVLRTGDHAVTQQPVGEPTLAMEAFIGHGVRLTAGHRDQHATIAGLNSATGSLREVSKRADASRGPIHAHSGNCKTTALASVKNSSE